MDFPPSCNRLFFSNGGGENLKALNCVYCIRKVLIFLANVISNNKLLILLQVFTLTFRGLSFEFPAETQYQPRYGGIRQELGRLQFPPGESPRVSKMYIYSGSSSGSSGGSSGGTGSAPGLPNPAESVAPAPPPPRYPCVHHQGVEVIRRNR